MRKIVFAYLLISTVCCLAQGAPQAIAMNCSTCHRNGAEPKDSDIPSLEGMRRDEMTQALLDFKYDRKTATLMPRIAKGYSDAELRAVAGVLSRSE
jgi:sulfide dehydrogenase cytochrome subunit